MCQIEARCFLWWRRNVLFFEPFINFQGCQFFSVIICSCLRVHAFPGAVVCYLQLKEEAKQNNNNKKICQLDFFCGDLLGFFILASLFFFVAFTGQGRKPSSYRENLVTSEGVFYFCKPKWFLLFSLKTMWLHLFFSPMCYLIDVKCAK